MAPRNRPAAKTVVKTQTIKPKAPKTSDAPMIFGGLAWPNFPRGRDVQAMALQVEFAMVERWPFEKIQHYQLAQAQALINHAHKTVPYYKDILAPFAGKPLGQLTMAEFRKIPLLNRTLIQDHKDALVTTSLPASHGRMFDVRTSGSTGRPMEVKGTAVTGTMYMAQSVRGHIWHQRDLTLKNVTIRALNGDKEIEYNRGWSAGSVGLNVMLDKKIPSAKILDILVKEDPDYLQCYPSTLRDLLRLSIERKVKLNKLREVRTLSEILEPDLVIQVKKHWGIRVVNNYSAMEINVIALECPDEPKNMHIMAESVLLEVLDDDGNACQPGEIGRCVVTTLSNYATPLIRYEYGDYAEVGPACSCGRGLPALTKIIGRKHNLMVLANGDKFSPTIPPSDALFELPLRQYQLVQTSLEEVEIRVVTDRKLTVEEEGRLIKIYKEEEKYPFNFTVKYMEGIPSMASGKYDLFRSEVDV